MSKIWSDGGRECVRPIAGRAYRIVETQEQAATMEIVSSLDAQDLLERLLDESKPLKRPGSGALHYLLQSPFRYPPLEWGSRFGSTREPGYLYGALSIQTAMEEFAFYRHFLFQDAVDLAPGRVWTTQHTQFGFDYRTDRGIRLQFEPFAMHSEILRHPEDYSATQALGVAMRADGVLAFEYLSARDPDRGLNVALSSPEALANPLVHQVEQGISSVDAHMVTYRAMGRGHHFPLERYLVAGKLPRPAG